MQFNSYEFIFLFMPAAVISYFLLNKINYTLGKAGIEEGLKNGAKSMMGLIPYEIEAMKKVVANKIELFGSVGKA